MHCKCFCTDCVCLLDLELLKPTFLTTKPRKEGRQQRGLNKEMVTIPFPQMQQNYNLLLSSPISGNFRENENKKKNIHDKKLSQALKSKD